MSITIWTDQVGVDELYGVLINQETSLEVASPTRKQILLQRWPSSLNKANNCQSTQTNKARGRGHGSGWGRWHDNGNGNDDKPETHLVRQIYNRVGHTALDCYHHLDQGCGPPHQLVVIHTTTTQHVVDNTRYTYTRDVPSYLTNLTLRSDYKGSKNVNGSPISLVANPVLYACTKYVEINFHFVREWVVHVDIDVHCISTQAQIANVFKKGLMSQCFNYTSVKAPVMQAKYHPNPNEMD